MNGANRHAQYRKRIYRKRRIRILLICGISVLASLLVIFFIVGNILNSKKDNGDDTGSNPPPPSTTQDDTPVTIPEINGYPILIETGDSSTALSRFQALKNSGAKAACVPLNQTNGTLLYRSSISNELGIQSNTDYSVELKSAVQSAKRTGIYVSGSFHVTAFSTKDDLKRSVELSIVSAIIAEAFRSGIDDVLLIIPNLKENQLTEFYRFIEGIYLLCPNAKLGLAIGTSITYSQNSASIINALTQKLNFLALDLTDSQKEDPITYVEESVTQSEMRYNIIRYKMRVLIPELDSKEKQDELIAALNACGVSNWQILSSATKVPK